MIYKNKEIHSDALSDIDFSFSLSFGLFDRWPHDCCTIVLSRERTAVTVLSAIPFATTEGYHKVGSILGCVVESCYSYCI